MEQNPQQVEDNEFDEDNTLVLQPLEDQINSIGRPRINESVNLGKNPQNLEGAIEYNIEIQEGNDYPSESYEHKNTPSRYTNLDSETPKEINTESIEKNEVDIIQDVSKVEDCKQSELENDNVMEISQVNDSEHTLIPIVKANDFEINPSMAKQVVITNSRVYPRELIPYQCKKCQNTFSSKKDLNQHEKSVHLIEMFRSDKNTTFNMLYEYICIRFPDVKMSSNNSAFKGHFFSDNK